MQEGKYQMENGALIPTNFILLTNETESYFLLLFLASQSHLHSLAFLPGTYLTNPEPSFSQTPTAYCLRGAKARAK